MASKALDVLFFGDQTDLWADGIDQLYRQALTTPWLDSFLDDILSAFKESMKGMDQVLQDSLGNFSSLLELADRYRHTEDGVGMAHAVLLHAVRSAMLLQCTSQNPQLLSPDDPQPERIGISGGLTNLCALAIAKDFQSLYDAVLEVGRIFARLCRVTSVRSRAMEDRPGVWGWAILGIAPEELSKILAQYQQSIGIPQIKRAKIGVSGEGWSTIIGPPTVLELCVQKCPALKKLPKNPLNIHALQHIVAVSQTDMDFIIGDSVLLDQPIAPGFRVWGMDNPNAFYSNWGNLLRAVIHQVLSLPLDITKVVGQFNRKFASHNLTIRVIGPSSHTAYLASALKASGSHVTLRIDKSLELTASSKPGRIAIVGMAGRGPGCDNVAELWDLIMAKQDRCERVPEDRFDIEEYYSDRHTDSCTTTTPYGCFMRDPGNFDARFFKVSPREALLMDPGHRQFLMSTYEALEMAGFSDSRLAATDPKRIGVFYGQSNDDWHMVSHEHLGCDAYTLQGAQRAFGAGRVAYHFKWEGPTYSLDSACASTSSAIHLACMSLHTKDVDMAVVGAANILSFPHSWTSLSKSGVLSDTGNCKTYRDDADGYCRSDFVGSVVLKRLEDAEAANDNILAVIAASGRNHSGNSSSITTSDAVAQLQLFEQVLRNARLSADQVSYIEMHGTGTQIGDPAEMSAIANLVKNRRASPPLFVGGIKANIGHSEAAAGMSSLMKCVKIFQDNTIPPQAGMPHALNPSYPDLEKLNIKIPAESQSFKPIDNERRHILLNNFDASGGNACILLEDYGAVTKAGGDPRSCHIVTISAKTKSSLAGNKRNLTDWLKKHPDAKIQDIAYTTAARRMHHPLRLAYSVTSTNELVDQLQQDSTPQVPAKSGSIIFVFTGQGSDYAGMGNELYATSPVFRQTVDLCADICAQHGFSPFLDIITEQETNLASKDTMQVQLAVLVLEIGLAAFWGSCGIRPSLVLGHSLGEYTALYISGVLSLADVLYLVGHRARLVFEMCETGVYSMLAIPQPVAAVQAILDSNKHTTCIVACANSINSTVVSGSVDDITELREALGSRSTVLSVPYGFHSSQMSSIIEPYTALAEGIQYSHPKIPVVSTLLGSIVDTSGVFNAHYLGQQSLKSVNFIGALEAAVSMASSPTWLEIGPSRVCSSFIRSTLLPSPEKVLSSLDVKISPWTSISACLVNLYKNGLAFDFAAFHAPFEDKLKLLALPAYSWDNQNFWIAYSEASKTVPPAPRMISTCAQHVLHETTSPNASVTLKASIADQGFAALINGHRIREVSVCPGSVFCDAGIAAVRYGLQYLGRKDALDRIFVIRDLSLQRPLTTQVLGADGDLLTIASGAASSSDSFQVSWKVHSTATTYPIGSCTVTITDRSRLQADFERIAFFAKAKVDDLIKAATNGHGHRMLPDILYNLFSSTVDYDPPFKCIQEAFISLDFQEAVARVVLQEDPRGTQFVASPYWGESLVHLAGFLVNARPDRLGAKSMLMMDSFRSFEQVAEFLPGRVYYTYARVYDRGERTATCDVYVFDSQQLVMQCSKLNFHEVDNNVLDRLLGKAPSQSQDLYRGVPKPLQAMAKPLQSISTVASAKRSPSPSAVVDPSPDTQLFQIILESIALATGTKITDMSDDTMLDELGVDSIMGIEIAASVNSKTGKDIPAYFMIAHPTVGEVRKAFGGSFDQPTPAKHEEPSNESDPAVLLDVPSSDSEAGAGGDGVLITSTPSSDFEELVVVKPDLPHVDNASPEPKARITLLQGRSSSGKPAMYLIADGTGSVATYIHLPSFRSKMPVYGIDSPYLQCPDRLIEPQAGIEGAAASIVEALIKFQPDGPLSLGGFSGGGMLAYEVCRQLANAARTVDRLLIIDICCPRPAGAPDKAELGWKIYESIASQTGLWNVSLATQKHLRNIFASVAAYHPPPLTDEAKPRRTAIIWAKKGLIDRCSGDVELMRLLEEENISTQPYEGFMEDANMGAIAWGLPHKTEKDLGPNGWDKYIGEILCLSVDSDHLDMPMPGHVHLLHAAMEEALTYLDG